jgi:sodium/bile acid cotransporter 7
MPTLRIILSDKFIWLLLIAVLLATIAPVGGDAEALAKIAFNIGVFIIFLLHGIRLSRQEVIAGLTHWRLHAIIFGWVFGAMMLAGLTISVLLIGRLPADVALGFLFLGVLPTTIQSATSYCAIARGNLAASVVASAGLNLIGVLLSPLLFALLARSAGVEIPAEVLLRILSILLLPFIIGQIIQLWVRPWVMAHAVLTGWIDKGAIALAVYISFSSAVIAGVWQLMLGSELLWLCAGVAVLLAFGFGGNWLLGGWLGLARSDRKTLFFAGGQKSIAIGAPLAALIFVPERAGLIILPLIFYHLAQMFVSAPIAVQLARQ